MFITCRQQPFGLSKKKGIVENRLFLNEPLTSYERFLSSLSLPVCMNISTPTEEEDHSVYINDLLIESVDFQSDPVPLKFEAGSFVLGAIESKWVYTQEMIEIEPFFWIHEFAHRFLWKEKDPVWSPLFCLMDYLAAHNPKRIEIPLPEGVYLEHPESISIGEGTVIEPGVFIRGPCIVGKHCVIRHGAYLRGPVLLGNGCQIGHSAELKNAVLLDGAAAAHFVYVGDSIIGNSANLGAGVKCANLRLDGKEVSVRIEGKKYKTGLKKFGAIVGDRVQIGCNSVLNPGTLVGKESLAFPLTNLQGAIPPRTQIDRRGMGPIEKKVLETLIWQSNSSVPK